jgi:hypothetical protein
MAIKLTAAYVASITKPGLYCDAATAGLYLYVKDATRKYWVFRYSRNKQAHELGLGPAIGRAAPVSLADARAKATELRQALRAGRDPLAEKRKLISRRMAASGAAIAAMTTKPNGRIRFATMCLPSSANSRLRASRRTT